MLRVDMGFWSFWGGGLGGSISFVWMMNQDQLGCLDALSAVFFGRTWAGSPAKSNGRTQVPKTRSV